MNKFILVGLILLSNICYSQINKFDFPKEIISIKTNQHINIPGTRLFIIPPKDFKVSETFPAVYNKNGINSFIQVNDLNEKNFYEYIYSHHELQNAQLTVLYSGNLKINSCSGKIIFYKDSAQMLYNILFGDSTFTSTITAVFPTNDSLMQEQIKESLLTVYYDKSYNPDPFANAVFKIDDSKTIFKFLGVSGFSYNYTLNGKNIYDGDAPSVSILQIPSEENKTIKESADEWLFALTGQILTEVEIKNESYKIVNGIQCFQREIYARQNSKHVLLFQESMILNNQPILAECFAYQDYEKYLDEFKKLLATIQQK